MNPYQSCLVCYEAIADAMYHPRCAKKLFGREAIAPTLDFGRNDIDEIAQHLVSRRVSIPGVQRKVLIGETHILKLPAAWHPHLPEIEHLTMHLAKACQIKTVTHGLIALKDGSLAYITKRFDREGKRKIATEDLCQLSGLMTEQKTMGTAEQVGRIIRHHSSNPGDDSLRYFELTLFAFLIGNADMHMKNLSMITDNPRFITLSPAYNMLPTKILSRAKPNADELVLSIQGKKSSLSGSDFMAFADGLKIPRLTLTRTLDFFIEQEAILLEIIHKSILSEPIKDEYSQLLAARIRCIQ